MRLSDGERWEAGWKALKLTPPAGLFEEILARYGEGHRHYHTLRHLRECLEWLDAARELCERPAEVELALWFHDAIYDPGRLANEAESAGWAEKALLEAGASQECAGRVRGLVLATRHEHEPETPDQAILADIDFAILGANTERFEEYERQIREEYRTIPAVRFRAGRRALINRWLEAPSLYHTDFFRERLENAARKNLERVLEDSGYCRTGQLPSGS